MGWLEAQGASNVSREAYLARILTNDASRTTRYAPRLTLTLSFEILEESNLLVWLKCQEGHAKPFIR